LTVEVLLADARIRQYWAVSGLSLAGTLKTNSFDSKRCSFFWPENRAAETVQPAATIPAVKNIHLGLVEHLFFYALFLGPCFAQNAPPSFAKQKVLWQKLEADVHDVDQRLDGVMGVAIEDLATGNHVFLHEDEVFAQASSIKIAVLAELYLQAQQGKLKLTDPYTVESSDLVPDSNIMGGLTPGVTRLTLRDLSTMMVAVSDNSATNVLIDRVGMDNVNALLDSLGLAHTRLRRKMMDLRAAKQGRENISTPREMMMLLAAIYQGKLLNKESTADFLRTLSTNKESFLPRDLPPDLKVANKPGELEAVRNDSGIVFVEGRPYVICVMTAFLRNERDGEEAISKVSLDTWRMFDRLSRATEYGRVVSAGNGVR
jgi:beta-lactamase class A